MNSFATVAACCIVAVPALGHVGLDSPNGGEVVLTGSTLIIEWTTLIGHDQENWDLWYSTESSSGPWLDIAIDLPVGDFNSGSHHEFAWNAPLDAAATVWVRVRQDNETIDYYDTSDKPFSVVAPACPGDVTGDRRVDFEDLSELLDAWGTADAAADLNDSGTVDFDDLNELLEQWGVDCG